MRSISTLSNRPAYPQGRGRLCRLEEDLRRGLRQHDLGEMAVNDLKLRLALEPKNDRIARFPIFRDRSVQLRKSLKARQLIEHKPDRMLSRFWCAQEAQNEHVDPKTVQRPQRFALSRLRRDKDPAFAVFRPLPRGPFLGCVFFPRQEPEAVGNEAKEASTPDRCCGAERSGW